MDNINKNRWFISLMICIGIMMGLAIAYTTEIVILKNMESKINETEMNITYGDLQRYAKGSHQMGE